MVGGPGTDTFDAGGGSGRIDSRDGIAEQVVCGIRKPGVPQLRLINTSRRFAIATIDLVDTPDNAALITGGCTRIDRAPRGEKTAAQLTSTKLKVKRGKAGVKVRCTTSSRCKGKLSVTVKGRTSSKRFSIRGKGERNGAGRRPDGDRCGADLREGQAGRPHAPRRSCRPRVRSSWRGEAAPGLSVARARRTPISGGSRGGP